MVSHPDTARQRVFEAGAFWAPVSHDGNAQVSAKEVEAVSKATMSILGGRLTDKGGVTRQVEQEDIILVAPYNAQVNALRDAPPPGIRVGTVDKFQGQEAAICMISMMASATEGWARGMEFLFSLNCINVAISRAKTLALVFGAPRLRETKCKTIEQMRLANTLCALRDLSYWSDQKSRKHNLALACIGNDIDNLGCIS